MYNELKKERRKCIMPTETDSIPSIYPFSFNRQASEKGLKTEFQLPSNPLREDHKAQDEGPLESLISGKTRTLKATVNALLVEIECRDSLHSSLIQEVDEEVFRQREDLDRLRRSLSDYTIEGLLTRKNLEVKIENSVHGLEQERRKEKLECWRDLMFLKKYLMSALKEYWDMVRRGNLLQG